MFLLNTLLNMRFYKMQAWLPLDGFILIPLLNQFPIAEYVAYV